MRALIVALCVALCCTLAMSQPKKSRDSKTVRKEQAEVRRKMGLTQDQINTNKRNTANKLRSLNALNSQIDATAKRIDSIKLSIAEIDRRSTQVEDSINDINRKTTILKNEYAKSLKQARQRRRGMSELSLIFAAPSFNNAMKRMSYVQQLRASISKKAETLKELHAQLVEKQQTLAHLRLEQQKLLVSLNEANERLTRQRAETQSLVADLQREAGTLNQVLKDQRLQAQRLENELNRVIEEETRQAEAERRAQEEAQRRAREEADRKARAEAEARRQAQEQAKAQKKPKTTTAAEAPPTTPPAEAPAAPPAVINTSASRTQTLTGTFAQNKGKLLFPVSGQYKIVGTYGVHTPAGMPYVQTENNGIDIETSPGTNARAVFDGEVSTIFQLDGYHNVVLVRHGEYITIYANIDKLSVKKGDKVKAGQQLGHIYSDSDDRNRTILHFEMRKEKQKLNPLLWLRR